MDGVTYAGSPFDDYLRELDIAEDTAQPVETAPGTVSSSSIVSSGPGLPGAFLGQKPGEQQQAAAHAVGGGAWSSWAALGARLLPLELVALLCLPDARARSSSRPPTSPPRQDYRHALVSSSLLEASLPRATDRAPSFSAVGAHDVEPHGHDRAGGGGHDDQRTASQDAARQRPASEKRRRQQPLLAYGIGIALGLVVLIAWRAVHSSLWVMLPTVVLLAGSSLYLSASQPQRPAPLVRVPCISADRHPSAPPASASQMSAAVEIQALVAEAEAYDRTCNSVLASVWDVERDRPAPDTAPLLALRRRLADALSTLQHHVETAHANLHPLTSKSELYALSALYSLDPKPSFAPIQLPRGLADPTSPTRHATHVSTPLRRVRTTADSSTGVVERFVSPPPPVRASSYGRSGEADSSARATPITAAQLTMMPPRTPRMAKHGRASSTSSKLARAWSPAAFGGAIGTAGAGLLPSPSLSSGPASVGQLPGGKHQPNHRARNPSLDESDEHTLAASFSPEDDGFQVSRPVDCSPPPTATPLDDQAGKRAKRRSLQDIAYRHALSPLAQFATRRPPTEPLSSPSPLAAAPAGGRRRSNSAVTHIQAPSSSSSHRPGYTQQAGPRLAAHRVARSSFSDPTGRPTFGAHSPVPASLGGNAHLTRHRSTLSLAAASPSLHHARGETFGHEQLVDLPSFLGVRLPATPATADEVPLFSPPPTPLSHADLLATFCALHARRRHVLVELLALQRDLAPEAWAEAAAFVGGLRAAFDEAREDVSRALLVSRQTYGGDLASLSGDSSFAPPLRTEAENRRQCLSQLWDGLQSLTGKVGALEDVVETGDGWGPTWLELRDDLAELVRVWERSRLEMGVGQQHSAVDVTALSANQANETTDLTINDAHDDTTNDDPTADSRPEPSVHDVEDDVSRYLRESADALPSAGREELFAAESAPPVARRPPSKMSRQERIRLAKEHREETERAVREGKGNKGPSGMGDVILELNGLMRVLRRNKGPAAEAQDDAESPEPQDMLLDVVLGDDADETRSDLPTWFEHTAYAPSVSQPLATTRTAAPPLNFPLPTPRDRSSLPALSQGSSDGDLEGDGDPLDEVIINPRHREGSQVTLRAAESDDDEGSGSGDVGHDELATKLNAAGSADA